MSRPLTSQEIGGFQQRLEKLLASASGAVERVESATLVPSGADRLQSNEEEAVEEVALASELRTLEIEEQLATQARDALQRITDGTFGICVACGKSISRERLQELPQAPECVDCARKRER